MTIIGTGLTGLIGSRIVELLKGTYSFQNISRATGVDITNFQQVHTALASSDANIVIHLAADTDVKKAEKEKELGEKGNAWQVNVLGAENIAKACKETGKKLLYFSTDMVFDGEQVLEGGYTEKDTPHPLSWYAKTKYEGELRVQQYAKEWTILRVAYPYRAHFSKLDFVRLFIQKLQNNEELTVLSDRIITPTFIDDIAHAVDVVIRQNTSGIYHVVGSEALSIFSCAQKIAEIFVCNVSLIHPTTRAEFLVGRPPEPCNSALNNGKITRLGVSMHTFEEGLKEIKRQL